MLSEKNTPRLCEKSQRASQHIRWGRIGGFPLLRDNGASIGENVVDRLKGPSRMKLSAKSLRCILYSIE